MKISDQNNKPSPVGDEIDVPVSEENAEEFEVAESKEIIIEPAPVPQEPEKKKEMVSFINRPFWLTNWFVHHPFKVITLVTLICLLALVLVFFSDAMKLAERHRRMFLVWDDDKTTTADMYTLALKDLARESEFGQTPERTQVNRR